MDRDRFGSWELKGMVPKMGQDHHKFQQLLIYKWSTAKGATFHVSLNTAGNNTGVWHGEQDEIINFNNEESAESLDLKVVKEFWTSERSVLLKRTWSSLWNISHHLNVTDKQSALTNICRASARLLFLEGVLPCLHTSGLVLLLHSVVPLHVTGKWCASVAAGRLCQFASTTESDVEPITGLGWHPTRMKPVMRGWAVGPNLPNVESPQEYTSRGRLASWKRVFEIKKLVFSHRQLTKVW